MRTFVIINIHEQAKISEKLLAKLDSSDKIIIFHAENVKTDDVLCVPNTEFVKIPDELKIHGSKLRNFISKYLLDNKIQGFVHVIEDSIEIFGDVQPFLNEIEKMMRVFKLKTWFNTSCDVCNYVFNKYNPRFFIVVDEPEAKAKYDKTIAWCSNANTQWVCYDMDGIEFEEMRFEEKFFFPMYYIIEYLARRRNKKKPGELHYMNFYPSVPEELNVFRGYDVEDIHPFTNEEISNEDKIFHEMNVDNHPDQNLDQLMEDMRNAILAP